MTQKWNSIPLRRRHLNRICSSNIAIICSITNCREREKNVENKIEFSKTSAIVRIKLPVQNFGSSLKSPQWSKPSQYLSNGRHRPEPLHENSDTLHGCASTMRFNNKTLQAMISHRMIWKIIIIMKKQFSSCNTMLLLLEDFVMSMMMASSVEWRSSRVVVAFCKISPLLSLFNSHQQQVHLSRTTYRLRNSNLMAHVHTIISDQLDNKLLWKLY